jgi:hypothetical protein
MPVAAPLIGGVASIAGAALSKPKAAKDPNAYLQPYMKDAAGSAQGLFKSGGPQLWDQSTVAGMGDQTQQALQSQFERGANGSPLVDAAQGFVQQGLTGPAGGNPYADTANPFGQAQNPYLDAAFSHMAQKSQNVLASEFAGSGRNIDASAPARGDMLSSLAAQVYAPAYENERNRMATFAGQQQGIGAQGYENAQGRQQNLLQYATPLANQDYLDIANQRDVGGVQDAYSQANLSDQVARFREQQAAPGANLDAYLARIGGLSGKAGAPVQPQASPNYLAAGIGGAMAGNELFPYQRPAVYQPYKGTNGGLSADSALQMSLGGVW